MMEHEGGYNFDDWAKVSCGDMDDEQGSSSSSSAEVVIDNTAAKFMIRRDSTDSVEIMSLENEDDADSKSDDMTSSSGHFQTGKMCCSTCSTIMNQSMSSSSMVHVKMEEIETQTEALVDLGFDLFDLEVKEEKPKDPPDEDLKPPCEKEEEEESQLEMALDSIAEFIHRHGHQLIFIPTHLLFALLVLSAAHLTGIARIEALEPNSHSPVSGDMIHTITMTSKSTVTTSATESANNGGQQSTTTIRELQSPEWLDRLSSLLDDVSSELAAVDGQISVVERQLDVFDEQQQQLGSLGTIKQQLFVVDAYRQLVERQRQTARLLDKINSVLNVDRQSRREPATLLDVRLKLVDLAGDFVQLNSRLTEVTFANKRRHISVVKKATSERHRQEAAFLASLVDRVRNSDAAQSVPLIDDKSAACRRLFRPSNLREEQSAASDLVECLSKSRSLAAETWRQMNTSLEQERLASLRYRNRALFAEIAVSDLREEVSFLNQTLFLQEQLRKLKEKQQNKAKPPPPSSFLQCLSQFSDLSSFAELLRRPEHCATCDLIDRLSEQFIRLLNRISAALLSGTGKEWSAKTVLDMLGSTFSVLSNSQVVKTPPVIQKPTPAPPLPPLTFLNFSPPSAGGWTSRLRSKFGAVKNTISTAYNHLKRSVLGLHRHPLSNSTTVNSVCPSLDAEFERIRNRVESLQTDRQYYSAAVLNSLFKDMTNLQEKVDSGLKCLSASSRLYLKCHLAWGLRMMRLFSYPICSDRLPSDCTFMPWQQHLMASIEETSFSVLEEGANSTAKKVVVENKNEAVEIGPQPRPVSASSLTLPSKSTSLSMLPVWQFFVKKQKFEEPVQNVFRVRRIEHNRRGDDGSPSVECAYKFLTRTVKDLALVAPQLQLPIRRHVGSELLCQASPMIVPARFEQLPALPLLLPSPPLPSLPKETPEQKKPEEILPLCRSRDQDMIANNLKSDAFLNVVKRMHA